MTEKTLMTNDEAIAACQRGERVVTWFTLSDFKNPDPTRCAHDWRGVACNDVLDVIECRHCGDQRTAKCDFDDECS